MRLVLTFVRTFEKGWVKSILKRSLVVGGVLGSYGLYSTMQSERKACPFTTLASCASKIEPQGSVVSETKSHALYLTIHIDSKYAKDCAKVVCQLKKYVDTICPPEMRDESDEILYGVGFGPTYYRKIQPQSKVVGQFEYRARSGRLGDLPNTGGDIFIHAKCNERGKLFELTQAIIQNMPQGAVLKFEDVYGWVYRNGRDLSGFIDGTANPADPDERVEVAVDPKTGSSFAIVQKWIHNHQLIQSSKTKTKEEWIGRTLADSIELANKSDTSHVTRMDGDLKIVRQSQPYGTFSGDSGLMFIAYAASAKNFDWMLDRMTGEKGSDGKCDDVMRMTRCVSGNYWYFPSQAEFNQLLNESKWNLWR